ncbi:MAG: CopG family antitoxin [Thermodesulfobacteriota bacterium]|nr:CopG family antitoxin [Thermodesulfobacteriota bacterium]
MRKQKLPKTDSISELAQFWDKHDITDFEDLLEEVTEPIFSKGKDIQLHLEKDDIESLEKIAYQRGLKNNDLIREWILEKLYDA